LPESRAVRGRLSDITQGLLHSPSETTASTAQGVDSTTPHLQPYR
jgi:hypothetical protein